MNCLEMLLKSKYLCKNVVVIQVKAYFSSINTTNKTTVSNLNSAMLNF